MVPITSEIKKLAKFLVFSAELKQTDIFTIIDRLFELVNDKKMVDPETLTLSRDALSRLTNVSENFPVNKTTDNSVPKIMAIFLRALDTASKKPQADPDIMTLRNYLFERWESPGKLLNIKSLNEVKNKLETVLTGISPLLTKMEHQRQ